MTQEPRQSGSDLIGELQRWLVRSGARSVSRELSGQIRTALGGGHDRVDVWETATSGYDSPECAWCPICRARRRLREQGPGLASGVAAAADAVNVVMQDAMSAFEAAVAAAGRQARTRPGATPPGGVWDEAAGDPGRDPGAPAACAGPGPSGHRGAGAGPGPSGQPGAGAEPGAGQEPGAGAAGSVAP